MMPRDPSKDRRSEVPPGERPKERRSASPTSRISATGDKGTSTTQGRRWQQRDMEEGEGTIAGPSRMGESHLQPQQHTQGPRGLPPLSHMIALQGDHPRISHPADSLRSGTRHPKNQFEAPQEGTLSVTSTTLPRAPPYSDPPRYPSHLPSHLSVPQPNPPFTQPSKPMDLSQEARRERGGLALSVHPDSNDRSRTSIGSLLSPLTSHLSPPSTSQDLNPASPSSMQVDLRGHGSFSVGYFLDGRRRAQGDFDDAGTASDFLMRTRRSRSPFQVDLNIASDRGMQVTGGSYGKANVSHSTPSDPSAESSSGPFAEHSASSASRAIGDGVGGDGHISNKAWSVERAAPTHVAAVQGPAKAPRNAMPPSQVVAGSDEYSQRTGHSGAGSNNTMDASLSAPALTQVFKEWLSDVARQAVSTHDDPGLEIKLARALAARDDHRLKELGHGLIAAIPSLADVAQGRDHPSALSTAKHRASVSASASNPRAEGSSRAGEREVLQEAERGQAMHEAYRQGYSDGAQAERKRSYQKTHHRRFQPEPLFWAPPDPQQTEPQAQSLVGGTKSPKFQSTVSIGKRRHDEIGSPPSTAERIGKRQPISCNNCRLRKLRCDGVPPSACTACEKRSGDDTCEYVSFIRRRGPGKKTDGPPSSASVSPQWQKYDVGDVEGDILIGRERLELDEHDELLSPPALEG